MAPRIYFLLSGKSQLMYENFFDLKIAKAAYWNCAIEWSSSMADFEFTIFNISLSVLKITMFIEGIKT